MSHRPRVYRLDELEDGAEFQWTDNGASEIGVVLYPDDTGMTVRLRRGRGWLVQYWPGATLVRRTATAVWQEEDE